MNQLPREGCGCPTTNGQQWHTYECTFAETPSVSWETEFDEKFGDVDGWTKAGDRADDLKIFIRETLSQQKQDLCARLEGLKSEGDSLVKDVRNDTLNQAIQAIKE